jgi:tRNA dimethylallyltransferase
MNQKNGQKPKAVLIAGPTASGKSALAQSLARALGGTVINADSMQVYREMRILTARPTPEEEAAIPHRLYGMVSAAEPYSVARWLDDVKATLAQAAAEGRVPVIVGGTGLYFEALTKGLAAIPPIPTEIREALRAAQEAMGTKALHARLLAKDPAMGVRLLPSDSQRVLRALEVLEATGRSLAAWQAEKHMPPILPLEDTAALVLCPPKDVLYPVIDARFQRMMDEGAEEEVRRLLTVGLPDSAAAYKALGVAPLLGYLGGLFGRDEAIELGQRSSRNYAKRQGTWLRNKMISWKWYETQYSESLRQEILAFVTHKG